MSFLGFFNRIFKLHSLAFKYCIDKKRVRLKVPIKRIYNVNHNYRLSPKKKSKSYRNSMINSQHIKFWTIDQLQLDNKFLSWFCLYVRLQESKFCSIFPCPGGKFTPLILYIENVGYYKRLYCPHCFSTRGAMCQVYVELVDVWTKHHFMISKIRAKFDV